MDVNDAAAEQVADPLVEAVGEALIADATDGEQCLADLDDETRQSILGSARIAAAATTAWFGANDWRLVPPGTFAAPTCEEEARAMAAAAKDFLAGLSRKPGLLATPARKLILPPGMH